MFQDAYRQISENKGQFRTDGLYKSRYYGQAYGQKTDQHKVGPYRKISDKMRPIPGSRPEDEKWRREVQHTHQLNIRIDEELKRRK